MVVNLVPVRQLQKIMLNLVKLILKENLYVVANKVIKEACVISKNQLYFLFIVNILLRFIIDVNMVGLDIHGKKAENVNHANVTNLA